MGIISLIVGIIALLSSIFFVGAQWIGAMIGLVGMLCGALGRMNSKSRDIANAGFVCSILAFVFGIIFYASCMACLDGSINIMHELNKSLEEAIAASY